ncbi:MAG: glycerol-3-phosphate 1-O-acyltransferase PlsY [Kiritimatiellaeota bacterium]|nr:glycerol-3-phosphate 1-O-acyltransferase PlsY [Kiritimatiellota bacterium]
MVSLGAYLLGAVPFGFLIAKARGVDIRAVGSKNIGATNVFRSVGKGAGAATFALDMGKGFFATLLLPALASRALGFEANQPELPRVVAGACVVAGHNWTCFLGFKGGKGVATSLGLLFGLCWEGAVVALAVWVVALAAWRYVSLASILAAAALGVSAWFVRPGQPWWLSAALTALAALAILMHRANIRRLLDGTELRFGRKPRA